MIRFAFGEDFLAMVWSGGRDLGEFEVARLTTDGGLDRELGNGLGAGFLKMLALLTF